MSATANQRNGRVEKRAAEEAGRRGQVWIMDLRGQVTGSPLNMPPTAVGP
jgi:hypothetical protein